jgi:hypothetical protein
MFAPFRVYIAVYAVRAEGDGGSACLHVWVAGLGLQRGLRRRTPTHRHAIHLDHALPLRRGAWHGLPLVLARVALK